MTTSKKKSYLFEKETQKTKKQTNSHIQLIDASIYLNRINQKEYRSIKKSLFFSLILPGSGQAYVGHYFKAIGYLVIETSLILSWYHFVVTKKNRAEYNAQKFADEFYSLHKYEQDVISHLTESDLNKKQLYPNRDDLCSILHNPINPDPQGSFSTCRNYGSNQIYTSTTHYRSIQEEENLKDSLITAKHNYRLNRFYNIKEFYSLINRQSGRLSLGWLDANDPIEISPFQAQYSSLFKRTQKLENTQSLFLGGLILNHIISAIDASLSAYFHNQKLYKKEPLTWYQTIHFYSFLDLNSINTKIELMTFFDF